MSDFKAEMHQIRFPDPTGGVYSAPPDTLAAFKGPTSKGRGGDGRGDEGTGKGLALSIPTFYFMAPPMLNDFTFNIVHAVS